MIITGTSKNIAKVVLQILQCLKKCSKCCKVFQKENVAGAVGLFECCGDVNKRCKCARFPTT